MEKIDRLTEPRRALVHVVLVMCVHPLFISPVLFRASLALFVGGCTGATEPQHRCGSKKRHDLTKGPKRSRDSNSMPRNISTPLPSLLHTLGLR